MHYQSIVLELLEDRPQLRAHLKRQRRMLLAVESGVQTLKAIHENWKAELSRLRPDSAPSQIASEALELALAELTDRLPCESSVNDETPALDKMLFQKLNPSSNA
jgi:hypothetical protein